MGQDLSPDAPSNVTIDWGARTLVIGSSNTGTFNPITGEFTLTYPNGATTYGTLTNSGFTGSSSITPLPRT